MVSFLFKGKFSGHCLPHNREWIGTHLVFQTDYETGVLFVGNIDTPTPTPRAIPMTCDRYVSPGDGSREDPVDHLRWDGCKEKIQLILWIFIFKRQIRTKIWICSVTETNRKSVAPSIRELSRLRRASNEPSLLHTHAHTYHTHAH